ncbi:MAG: histidyl-tRNA synthetase [Solirubrobacterales bacterium]|jgi:histidyl-tRNA synthetase|nr:histidyl-tRNA synthetase [Solirubrobacterales bacterium]
MTEKFKVPRGTFDVLPEGQPVRRRIADVSWKKLEAAGYGRIDTPVFEDTDLFARGVGESTDIVQKQMFTFEDQGGRSLTLRPEATASVCRAFLEHGMQKLAQPVKLWTGGPFFRHERPQAGRYRQFTQVDAEAIGSDSPLVDAELILLANDIVAELGVEGVRLRLGSLGTPATRAAYLDELREYLRSHQDELSDEVRDRIDANPLRAFDADHEGTRNVMTDAPTLLARLDPEDAEHFAEVRALLDRSGVAYELDPTLVRGLDYYTRTVFEFECERLGAQSGIGGGGRYDGLIEQLGGPPTPGCGWALGVDRVALALEPKEATAAEGDEHRDGVFVVAEDGAREGAFALVAELRRAGIRADLDLAGRAIKGQMKQADRFGARYALILSGDAQATLRDMSSGEEREIDPAALVETLSSP